MRVGCADGQPVEQRGPSPPRPPESTPPSPALGCPSRQPDRTGRSLPHPVTHTRTHTERPPEHIPNMHNDLDSRVVYIGRRSATSTAVWGRLHPFSELWPSSVRPSNPPHPPASAVQKRQRQLRMRSASVEQQRTRGPLGLGATFRRVNKPSRHERLVDGGQQGGRVEKERALVGNETGQAREGRMLLTSGQYRDM